MTGPAADREAAWTALHRRTLRAVAASLHDGVSQDLTGAALLLGLIRSETSTTQDRDATARALDGAAAQTRWLLRRLQAEAAGRLGNVFELYAERGRAAGRPVRWRLGRPPPAGAGPLVVALVADLLDAAWEAGTGPVTARAGLARGGTSYRIVVTVNGRGRQGGERRATCLNRVGPLRKLLRATLRRSATADGLTWRVRVPSESAAA